jgi:phage shock protein PspC (stress-responsive transcriptional regulator)
MEMTDEPTQQLPPGEPPPPEPEGPRRLKRSRDDRLIAGVCGGLGRYFGIDPVIFRVGAVALIFLGGAGVLLYLAAIFLVPSDGEQQGGRNLGQRGLAILGIVLLVIAGGAILSHGPFHFWFAWPFGLLLLLGLGIWWLVTADRSSPSSGSSEGGANARDMGRRLLTGLGVLILSGALAVAGAWLAGTAGGITAGIVVIGAGAALAVGAYFGFGRWLILPALAFALPVGVVSAAGIDLHGGAGNREYTPVSATQVRDSYRLGAGRLIVDLRDAQLPSGDHPVKLRVGVGQAVLVVPSNVCVATKAHVGIGDVESFDNSHGGVDVDFDDQPATVGTNPRVVLDAKVGMGEVLVSHTRSAAFDHHRFKQFRDNELAGQSNTGCEVR